MSEVKKRLRQGKELVLPQLIHLDHEDASQPRIVLDYSARINRDKQFGRLGRIMVLRYNPRVGSSNPVAQVLLRCNLDVQCMDRVHVLLDELEVSLLRSSAAEVGSIAHDAETAGLPASSNAGSNSTDGHVQLRGAGPFDEEDDFERDLDAEADDPVWPVEEMEPGPDMDWLLSAPADSDAEERNDDEDAERDDEEDHEEDEDEKDGKEAGDIGSGVGSRSVSSICLLYTSPSPRD